MTQDFRKTSPEPLAPISFNLAQPFETTLANGLKIVVFENKRLPLVNFRLAFKSGSIDDPADIPGLTDTMARLLNEGTSTRSSLQIAEAVERIGGSLSANSSSDNTIVAASALNLYRHEILDLMADIVLNPSFPAKELGIYTDNHKEELKMQRSQPDFLAGERTAKILYGEHPYSIVSTTPEALDQTTSEKLADFHRAKFVPNNAIFVAVGDVDSAALVAEIEELFGAWEKGEIGEREFPAIPERAAKTLTIVNRAGSSQANIILGNPAITRTDDDFFTLTVMNMVLGGGASSRLFMNLREEKGYTYGAYSALDARRHAGLFEATSEVRTAVAGDSLKEFFYELNRIRDEAVPEEELADAKNYIAGSFPLRMETQEGLTNQIVTQQIFGLPEDYLQTFRDKINAVTADDVQRMAQKYVHPDKLAIIMVGDAAQLLDQVKPYAENIEIYDNEGNLKDINSFIVDPDQPPANVAGNWTLTMDNVPLGNPEGTMSLQQTDAIVSGTLSIFYFGDGELNGTVTGNSITMIMPTGLESQIVLTFNGTVDGDSMSGIVSMASPILPEPLTFPFSAVKNS